MKVGLALSDKVWYYNSTIHTLLGRTVSNDCTPLFYLGGIFIKVLSLDPSGNYNEGKGTTGWAYFEDGELVEFGTISASDCCSVEGYWSEHEALIVMKKPNIVVCEGYRLFAHKQKAQTWSQMETPQLIGYIRMSCWKRKIDVVFQSPQDKVRVADPILVKMGVFEKKGSNYYCKGKPTNLHIRDSIRHGIYFHKYRKEGVENGVSDLR